MQSAGALVTLAFLVCVVPLRTQAGTVPFPVIGRSAPDFALTDQEGRRVSLSDFRGRLVLLNFIYTRCTDVCPLTTATLTRVQRGLIKKGWWARDVVFLTITTDPAHDTAAVLRTYARRYRADARGWHFLTGDEGTLRAVYRRYGIRVQPAGSMQVHDLPTFVIDRRGVVLGAYPLGFEADDVLSDLAHLR